MDSDLSMPHGIRAPDLDSTTRYVFFSRIEGWDWYYFSVDCPNVRYRSNPHSTNRIRNKTVLKRTVTRFYRVRKHCYCERQPRAVQLGTVPFGWRWTNNVVAGLLVSVFRILAHTSASEAKREVSPQ
jgi:hypothetical protein